jgi:predicted SAM-dependent methyltransferase
MRYLNLGCGSRFHPDWINLDIKSSVKEVKAHNLKNGIPYATSTIDVIYHSHLLEHFSRDEALILLRECYRVLKPDGIIRVVVPDLEQIALTYLQVLDRALQDIARQSPDYEWIMLELYDQTVREKSGGAMLAYLKQESISNIDFVFSRFGYEAQQIVRKAKSEIPRKNIQSLKNRHISKQTLDLLRAIRETFIKRLLGNENYRALEIGRFRQRGEIHKWMYDRYSLAQLLLQVGFESPNQCSAIESAIPNWTSFNLDTAPDGTVYKPDSLFMEACRPSK